MSRLTRAAKGQECTVNLFPYCDCTTETTVLAHAPSEDKGWARKSPDWWGADCCNSCHEILDGKRRTEIPKEEIYRCHMRGVFRTIKRRINMGLIEVDL